MTEVHTTIEGHPATRVLVHVPGRGPWFADVDLETDPELEGQVTMALGALELVGTVRATEAGTHGMQRRVRVVAGGGGWGTTLPAKAYHNDARIRARMVVEDAAREAGEELGDFDPSAERIGIDYVRSAGAASRVLEDVIGAVPWWVGYDGRTHVGARSSSEASADAYEVLDYDPRARVATLAVDDLSAIVVGSVLSERLDAPQTVRELELDVGAERVRVRAWCGDDSGYGHLWGLMRASVRRATDDSLFGVYKYRVVQMSGDRVELQAVRREFGLPDIKPISMWPGLAGVHAELAGSSEVLVAFIDGQRTQPIVTHFAGKDGVGWTPTNVVVSASTRIRLGSASASHGVPFGDTLKSWLDDHTHSYVAPGSGGSNALTTPPASAPIGTPDPSPDPSSKVLVE